MELTCPEACSSHHTGTFFAVDTERGTFRCLEVIFRVSSAAREELSEVEEGQAAHSEKWTDSAGDVKELLWMGSSEMIKILPWLRLTASRMPLLSLAENSIPGRIGIEIGSFPLCQRAPDRDESLSGIQQVHLRGPPLSLEPSRDWEEFDFATGFESWLYRSLTVLEQIIPSLSQSFSACKMVIK